MVTWRSSFSLKYYLIALSLPVFTTPFPLGSENVVKMASAASRGVRAGIRVKGAGVPSLARKLSSSFTTAAVAAVAPAVSGVDGGGGDGFTPPVPAQQAPLDQHQSSQGSQQHGVASSLAHSATTGLGFAAGMGLLNWMSGLSRGTPTPGVGVAGNGLSMGAAPGLAGIPPAPMGSMGPGAGSTFTSDPSMSGGGSGASGTIMGQGSMMNSAPISTTMQQGPGAISGGMQESPPSMPQHQQQSFQQPQPGTGMVTQQAPMLSSQPQMPPAPMQQPMQQQQPQTMQPQFMMQQSQSPSMMMQPMQPVQVVQAQPILPQPQTYILQPSAMQHQQQQQQPTYSSAPAFTQLLSHSAAASSISPSTPAKADVVMLHHGQTVILPDGTSVFL